MKYTLFLIAKEKKNIFMYSLKNIIPECVSISGGDTDNINSTRNPIEINAKCSFYDKKGKGNNNSFYEEDLKEIIKRIKEELK